MSKKAAIIVSVVLALVFTVLVTANANRRFAEATRTVEVVQTTQYIPAGAMVDPDDIKLVKVPDEIAAGLIQDPDKVVGKITRVGLVKGQYIWEDTVGPGLPCRPGYIEVHVPTDLSSSACVIAGDRVNVYPINKSAVYSETPPSTKPLAEGLRVLHSYDQSGQEIDPVKRSVLKEVATSGKNVAVSVALEVPKDMADQIVKFASHKAIYLTKCPPDRSWGEE
ncbi:MAG: hypothetical protein H0Z39_03490 [Peptococcaceae bacterium]|nr:hypothetical protein [Peptococcaceae bacterium]